jgi:hypothetical protein
MAPVETEYYDLVRRYSTFTLSLLKSSQLKVAPDADAVALKKAYRKAAMTVCSHCMLQCIANLGFIRPFGYSITLTRIRHPMQRRCSRRLGAWVGIALCAAS